MQEIVDRDALRTLHYILRQLPARVQLVLLSRVDPPLALVRLRLEGRLAELRAEHLRFTRPEYCRAARPERPGLTPDQVGTLHEATDGWPAGLRLAVSSLGAAASPDQFLVEFSGDEHSVADYLVDEVLRTMPADTCELLGLERLRPDPRQAAVELSGRQDAAREARRTPTRLGADHSWPTAVGISSTRSAALVRLRAELARQRPTLIFEPNARAARWWAARDQPVEASGRR